MVQKSSKVYGNFKSEKHFGARRKLGEIGINRVKKPFFGICLGHQLLGEALGALVVKSQTPEIGFKEISVKREVYSNNLFGKAS